MANRRYAETTKVPVDRSRAELEALLQRHGATQRAVYFDDEAGKVHVQFRITERMVRLTFDVPQKAEQKARQAWRRTILIVKAKLELVADGASTIEREFLADILLPDGTTVHEILTKQLVDTYKNGKMPPLLGAASKS